MLFFNKFPNALFQFETNLCGDYRALSLRCREAKVKSPRVTLRAFATNQNRLSDCETALQAEAEQARKEAAQGEANKLSGKNLHDNIMKVRGQGTSRS